MPHSAAVPPSRPTRRRAGAVKMQPPTGGTILTAPSTGTSSKSEGRRHQHNTHSTQDQQTYLHRKLDNLAATANSWGSRQEGRRDRLRDGQPRQQDRLRPGPGPDQLRTGPLGQTTPRGFLDRCPPPPRAARSTWSARSAARTNEVDPRPAAAHNQAPRKPEAGAELTLHNQSCR